MGADDQRWKAMVQDFGFLAAGGFLAWYLLRTVLDRLDRYDPEAGSKAEAKQKEIAARQRLNSILSSHNRNTEQDDDDDDYTTSGSDSDAEPGQSRRSSKRRRRQRSRQSASRDRRQNLDLNEYEQRIAMEVVSPASIPVSFADIGGLENIIEELREAVIYPLTMPHLYSNHSSLLTAPSGVLLYGPPGCGKTMLAKALARESGACFINLHISTLTEKWYGDSNKLVAAVFSLARKLQPSIVFIDEIDAVLGTRRSGEHEASGMVKAEFMTHWDGLASATRSRGEQRVCILGATNRIGDIDEAILRRMPKKFPVALPNAAQRRSIFELTLRDTKIDRGFVTASTSSPSKRKQEEKPAFDLETLTRLSAGMSGSDIKEACRDAAMVPVREYIKAQKERGRIMQGIRTDAVRGLQTEDFFGLRKTRSEIKEIDDDANSVGSGSTEEVDEFTDADVAAEEEVVR